MELLKGIIPAMLTPMDDQGNISETGTRLLVRHLLNAGVHGIFALGTNGEFFALSEAEKYRVAEIVIDEVNKKVPVVIGTGNITTRETQLQSRKMEDLGADYLSVITPYFNSLTQKEVINHYRQVADAVNIPITLYNIPARTGIQMSPDTIAELAHVPNIVGVKDSSGNFDQILQFIEVSRAENFGVYAGTDSMILWTLLAGGYGAVAATANVVPDLVVSIYNYWSQNDLVAAAEAQTKLRAIRNASSLGSLPAAFKAAVNLLGIPVGYPRLPVEPLDQDKILKLKQILNGYHFDV